jgi:Ser/Thr protein kinase RdoA (MazF antagonist)
VTLSVAFCLIEAQYAFIDSIHTNESENIMTNSITANNEYTYKIEKNEKYGDFRVVEYLNGEWNDEFDNNWNEEHAKKMLKVVNGRNQL